MGWEERNGRMYYYSKRREGDRVISEYIGAGMGAEAIATIERIDQEKQKLASLRMHNEREKHMKDERDAKEFGELTRLLTRASRL